MVEHDEELPPALREATRLLREEPVPSRDWRDALEREVAAVARPERGRRWSVRPFTAVAAALVCALIGASSAVLVMRGSARSPVPTRLAGAAQAQLVRFTLVAPGASRVSIVGDFNKWDPSALPLRRSADGQSWEVEIPLQPGRYAYSFVVDGTLARDPSAPQAADDDFGQPNSVVLVKGS